MRSIVKCLLLTCTAVVLYFCIPALTTSAGSCSSVTDPPCACGSGYDCAGSACAISCTGHDWESASRDISCGEHCSGRPSCKETGSRCTMGTCGVWNITGQEHNHCEAGEHPTGTDTCLTDITVNKTCNHCSRDMGSYTVNNVYHTEKQDRYFSADEYDVYATSLESEDWAANGQHSSGHLSEDCIYFGSGGCEMHYRDKYLNQIYVRYQNRDGSFGSYSSVKSDYLTSGTTVSWSRAEDEDYLATAISWISSESARIAYVTVYRKGYDVIYDNNTGYGEIPSDYFIYGLHYNLSTGEPFKKRGYLLEGWADSPGVPNTKTWDLGQDVVNLAPPGGSITIYAQWEPIKYNVRYNDNYGATKLQPNCSYDVDYSVYTDRETGFSKTGYYLDGWSMKPGLNTPVYKVPVDPVIEPNRSTTDTFRNLSDQNGATVDLYAVWKPMPYVIRIYDNYNEQTGTCSNKSAHDTCSFHKDYVVYYDQEFIFPDALWTHENAVVMGYDVISDVYVNPMYRVRDKVTNLTAEPMSVMEFYTIWDNIPTITSPNEINFDYDTALGMNMNVENGTVSYTEIEAWLLSKTTASDYEWSKRYTGPIPVGKNNGYTYSIVSFQPDVIHDSASSSTPLSYTVTFGITDDAGNSATSVTKLFLGDQINILINTY